MCMKRKLRRLGEDRAKRRLCNDTDALMKEMCNLAWNFNDMCTNSSNNVKEEDDDDDDDDDDTEDDVADDDSDDDGSFLK